MKMRVHEQGDEVHVELNGVAGRQQRVLEALAECQRLIGDCPDGAPVTKASVSVRSRANDMHIRLKGHNGFRCEASVIYRCLRQALIEQPRQLSPASSGVVA
jgi:hypothetical protein